MLTHHFYGWKCFLHGQPNPSAPLSWRRPPLASSKCCKHAIRHACAYSRAGSAGTKMGTHLPAPTPHQLPALASTSTPAPGRARSGRGWQEGGTEARSGILEQGEVEEETDQAWEGWDWCLQHTSLCIPQPRQPYMAFPDFHQLKMAIQINGYSWLQIQEAP